MSVWLVAGIAGLAYVVGCLSGAWWCRGQIREASALIAQAKARLDRLESDVRRARCGGVPQ